jgi:hypothetical protein
MGASAAYACALIESDHSVITSSWGGSRILRLSYGMMKRNIKPTREIFRPIVAGPETRAVTVPWEQSSTK